MMKDAKKDGKKERREKGEGVVRCGIGVYARMPACYI